MPRFFIDAPLHADALLDLPDTVVRHVQVLRLKTGDTLTLFNGTGGEYPAVLTTLEKRHATAQLGEHDPREAEPPYRITLAQGIAGGDKMDWLIEKAIELGVTEIQPLATERSVIRLEGERAAKRVAHWQALVQAACEQCGRNRVPKVLPIRPITAWLGDRDVIKSDGWRVLLSPRADSGFDSLPLDAPSAPGVLLFGPEGGLAPQEEALARQVGFSAIRLGERILRTETAGMAVLAALAARWGGW
ncbi:16S rRNA (uracil(1498)-N(3))-methyltransferase [Pandoraea commovens]|uniref:Ribosomal RNA small subunit methyltransferase E n=1 Tax=Pandoraea commovens TaxID=2508289 RepID=A0A5E4Z3J9_9BURK|nr:16S rRNA (uracil(1498)-N(3))-methyltransferase [Pandoraea commovens]UVA78968.1 16S rRNA (uracil(1498)-N(3))-methyltransferase [Pandoraea commovens]VVE54910.1 16S rRNA (uracil(1498)-N(3))-methyltransferase [Pandoraea commovens]